MVFFLILGLGLACSFGILNAMWYEFREDAEQGKAKPDSTRTATKAAASP